MALPVIYSNTDVLEFEKNKEASMEFTISSASILEMKHNLPLCFTIDPIYSTIQPPSNVIKVTYYPNSPFHFMMTNRTMKIDFSAKPAGSDNVVMLSVVVLVADKIMQEQEEMEEEKQKVNLYEQLECKICARKYSEDIEDLTPIVLNCGHTICWSCVKSLQVDINLPVQCPFDRTYTYDSARNLPKNRVIIDMICDLKRMVLSQTHGTCDDPLLPCYENDQHEATIHCTTCKEDFCNKCFASTHSSRILSAHQAVPVFEKPLVPPNCTIHPDHEVRYVCTDIKCQIMSKLFCEECKIGEHVSHTFEGVEQLIENNAKDVEDAVKKLKEEEAKMLNLKMEKVKKVLKSFDKYGNEYVLYVNSITQYFEQKKASALKKFEAFVDSESAKTEQGMLNIQTHGDSIAALRKELEKMLCRRQGLFDVKDEIDLAAKMSNLENEVNDDFNSLSHFCILYEMVTKPTLHPMFAKRERAPKQDDGVVEGKTSRKRTRVADDHEIEEITLE
ncbi:hypothetical protein GCK72_003673 [Caenorhabditis remanei]|uniref:RING-type domain-containing protein n=1 Tax=Caenorhabditis remanei TaxID=31234 RepID=A0A6A5H7L2_CAERE|nr:hypothetical protein GCK72_003673 [Caenorhabditis remanei]KAF1763728.1 hypothetical protein GCK72_003673 [Caenorhabditis remanei]